MVCARFLFVGMVLGFLGATSASLTASPAHRGPATLGATSLSLSLAALQDERQEEEVVEDRTTIEVRETNQHPYLEMSDFFNVREANANVASGEWELEFGTEWSTGSGGDDDISINGTLKYGISDDMFIELEGLPINLGDGGDQGAGDLALILFNQFLHESDTMPAFAAWAEMRVPTGEGSSGVDAEVHFNLTKTLANDFRAHMEGFVETANGGRGDADENRRHFQWGTGFGFDYTCSDRVISTVNYLIASSEEYGHGNTHVVEIGMAYELSETQTLKVAFDVGVDGRQETADFATKIQWSVEF